MAKVNLLFKQSSVICQIVTFLNVMVMYITKAEKEVISFRE